MTWHWHLTDCFFNLLHRLKTTDSQNWHCIQFSGLLDEEKKKTWEKSSSLQRALSQSQWISFRSFILPPFFLILLIQSELFNWERRGGQTQTFSAPGPASSSAAVRAPLCWACWAESASGTKRCERWQTAAGPGKQQRGEWNEWSHKKVLIKKMTLWFLPANCTKPPEDVDAASHAWES